MRRGFVAALALALLGTPAAAQAKTVRAFAVGPKFALDWVDTRQHFHDHLLGLVDRSKRGPDVQVEADDVASHLLGGERDLVAFPEDLGLMAIFSGQRGAQARGASSVTEAIVDVLVAYAPQTAYYGAKFPALGQRGIPTRLLAIAATDTFARVAVETYSEIAATYHVWLEGGIDMAQDWHVVCDSKATMPALPGGVTCDEEDPAKVAQLRGPDEPDRTYAYEATTDKASNMALVFDPTGKLVSKQVKTYLTPVELPGQLDLLPGEVFTGLRALHTPVGTLGFVTSKDAWMPDVVSRLDQEHVDLLVQPEFFVGDTIQTKGPWAPDNIKGAGYSDVLRHPSIESMVLPELTGNLYDLSADNQQAIVVKPRSRRRPLGHLLGQPDALGFAHVGAWVAQDPLSPAETIAERRKRLGEIGEKLLPKPENAPCSTPMARGVCRGGQVEDVIFGDVQVGQTRKLRRVARRKRGRTLFSVSRPIAPSRFPQRNVALAARGKLVVAVFEQRRAGHDQVMVASSPDGGRHWGRARRLTGHKGANEWWPTVSIDPFGAVWVAWSDDSGGRGQRVYYGAVAGPSRRLRPVFRFRADESVGPKVQQMRPAIAMAGPAPGQGIVAFVDDRARFNGDDLPQAGIWVVPFDVGRRAKAQRIDSTDAPAELAKTLDHSWAPSLAVRGSRVVATWVDFRNYQWDVFSRASDDRGATWGAEQRVNTTPQENEALEDTPRAALTAAGPFVAFTDWSKSADSATAASPLYDVDVAVPGGVNLQADGSGGAHVDAFSPAIVAAGSGAVVAWQDHTGGPGDIYATRVRGGRVGRRVRVDDSGRTGWNQWRPALALSRGRVIAAWEDERDGPAQIFFARAVFRRLG